MRFRPRSLTACDVRMDRWVIYDVGRDAIVWPGIPFAHQTACADVCAVLEVEGITPDVRERAQRRAANSWATRLQHNKAFETRSVPLAADPSVSAQQTSPSMRGARITSSPTSPVRGGEDAEERAASASRLIESRGACV